MTEKIGKNMPRLCGVRWHPRDELVPVQVNLMEQSEFEQNPHMIAWSHLHAIRRGSLVNPKHAY